MALADEVSKGIVYPLIFAEFIFSAPVRFWTGIGDKVFLGHVFTGSGSLGRVTPAEENTNLDAPSAEFVLSGLPPTLVSTALQEDYQGRPARMWFAVSDRNSEVLAFEQIFEGRMDVMEPQFSADGATIVLTAENVLIKREQPAGGRYTAADQESRFPGDRFFDQVNSLQDAQIVWGRG